MMGTKQGHRRKASTAMVSLAALALIAGGVIPARAQDSAPSPSPAPAPAPTPTRPASDFRLPPAGDGRDPGVQGPANNGLPPATPGDERPSPTPAPTPAPTLGPPPMAAPPTTAPTRPATTSSTAQPVPPRANQAPRKTAADSTQLNDAPPESPQSSDAAPGFESAAPESGVSAAGVDPAADETPIAAAPSSESGGLPWGWIALALGVLAAGFWYWRRKPALAGPDVSERSPAPEPAAPIRAASPVPPRATAPRAPAPSPAPAKPVIPSIPRPTPLVTRAAPENRALIAMSLDIQSINVTADHVAVGLSLNLLNKGTIDATGLMVRIALQQGTAMPEPVLARFFDGAGGSVLRDDMELKVGAGEGLTTEVHLPRAAIEPLQIGGKPVLIPVMAFDVTYHWDGDGDAFGQVAGSFVLGREAPAGGSDKLSPLPLDRMTYMVDRPGARATAMQRSQ